MTFLSLASPQKKDENKELEQNQMTFNMIIIQGLSKVTNQSKTFFKNLIMYVCNSSHQMP